MLLLLNKEVVGLVDVLVEALLRTKDIINILLIDNHACDTPCELRAKDRVNNRVDSVTENFSPLTLIRHLRQRVHVNHWQIYEEILWHVNFWRLLLLLLWHEHHLRGHGVLLPLLLRLLILTGLALVVEVTALVAIAATTPSATGRLAVGVAVRGVVVLGLVRVVLVVLIFLEVARGSLEGRVLVVVLT